MSAMTVTVTFAGSGDAFGSGGRFQACIHVLADGRPLMLDCGATSLVALRRQGIDPGEIPLVLVSHLHVDHAGGLPPLILDGQFSRRTEPLTIAGPPGTERHLAEAMELMFPGSSTVRRRFAVDVVELEPGPATEIDGVPVRVWPVDHGVPALGLRITVENRDIAYTGDTAWTPELIELADGADLFIAEAYFWDKPVPNHLRHADLRAHRHELRSARTVLTHMSADMLANAGRSEFDTADDGYTIVMH